MSSYWWRHVKEAQHSHFLYQIQEVNKVRNLTLWKKKQPPQCSKRAEESNYWGPLWVNCVPTLLTLILSNKHHFYPPSLCLPPIWQRESALTSNIDGEKRSSYVRLNAVWKQWPKWPKGELEVCLVSLFCHHWTLPASSGASLPVILSAGWQSSSWSGTKSHTNTSTPLK